MAAITANKVRPNRNVGELLALPVKSGETILQGGIVGCGADGLLVNVTAANDETMKILGIVMDDSANLVPAPTTANGSLLNDRSSEDAGDKTVRLVAVKGQFLMDFAVAISQANLGDKAFAQNNNDCVLLTADGVCIGTIVRVVSTSQAWVELNWGKIAE